MENNVTPKIKICGITSLREADYLNEAGADYAGFVFYEKSRRAVRLYEAQVISRSLYPGVQKVAVVVSPGLKQLEGIEHAGFEILQVHGTLTKEVLRECHIPIWRAVNIQNANELFNVFQKEPEEDEKGKIEAYVADGAKFGSGITFDWKKTAGLIQKLTDGKDLILAGGLTAENVREGIEIFHPLAVDVSSGVEGAAGKDPGKIKEFVRKIREI